MSQKQKSNVYLALAAMVIGVASIPVAAFVNWVLGLVMLGMPIFMIYRAS